MKGGALDASDVLAALVSRNRVEVDALVPVIQGYLRLCDESVGLKRSVSQLERRTKSLAEERQTLKDELHGQLQGEADAAALEAAKARAHALREEVAQSYKENARIAQELAAKISEVQALRDARDAAVAKCDDLQGAVSDLGDAQAALMRDLEREREAGAVVRDELRHAVGERDEALKQLAQVSDENTRLIQTVIEAKEREAEKMNAANEYYDNVVAQANLLKQMSINKNAAASLEGSDGDWMLTNASESACVIPRTVAHRVAEAHAGPVHSLAFTSRGDAFASCSADQKIKLWSSNKSSGAVTNTATLHGALASVLDVKLNGDPANPIVVASSADGVIRIWSAESGRCMHTLTGHTDKVFAVDLSPDNARRCVSGGQDRTIRTWDMSKGYCVQTIGCGSTCFDVCFSHDGGFIYSGHFDGSARIWSLPKSGIQLEKQITKLHQAQVASVQASPSGQLMVTSGKDNCIKVVDLSTFDVLRSLEAPGFRLGGIKVRPAISPDEAYVACGAYDGKVHVWNLTTGEKAAESPLGGEKGGGHKSSVLACAWSPAGSTLITGDQKGDIVAWN